MPLRAHLAELRLRLMLALIGIGVAAVGGWFLFEPVFTELQRPLLAAAERDDALVAVNFAGLASALDMRLRVALFLGLILGSPWWLYQVWAFIAPGLKRREKRYAIGFVGAAVPLFLGGVAAAWLVFPTAVDILVGFRPDDTEQLLDAQLYLTFAMRLLVAFGLAFVFPVVMVALSWLHVVPWKVWLRGWRWAIIVILVFAALMTPTPDVITMAIMAVPMIALYFGAIGIAALRGRRRVEEAA